MTTTISEIESFALEGLDFSPVCSFKNTCTNEAEWSIVLRCCGEGRILCSDHKEVFIRRWNSGMVLRCNGCDKRVSAWDSFLEDIADIRSI